MVLYGGAGHQASLPSLHDRPLVGNDLDRDHGPDVGFSVVTHLQPGHRYVLTVFCDWFCGVGLDERPDFG